MSRPLDAFTLPKGHSIVRLPIHVEVYQTHAYVELCKHGALRFVVLPASQSQGPECLCEAEHAPSEVQS